jgi:hypothetical protein
MPPEGRGGNEDNYPQPLLCLKPDLRLADLYDLRHSRRPTQKSWILFVKQFLFAKYGTHWLPLSVEKGGAVLYRDFVTILWSASLEYNIT